AIRLKNRARTFRRTSDMRPPRAWRWSSWELSAEGEGWQGDYYRSGSAPVKTLLTPRLVGRRLCRRHNIVGRRGTNHVVPAAQPTPYPTGRSATSVTFSRGSLTSAGARCNSQ